MAKKKSAARPSGPRKASAAKPKATFFKPKASATRSVGGPKPTADEIKKEIMKKIDELDIEKLASLHVTFHGARRGLKAEVWVSVWDS